MNEKRYELLTAVLAENGIISKIIDAVRDVLVANAKHKRLLSLFGIAPGSGREFSFVSVLTLFCFLAG